jgi:hypothetical protein
MGDLPVTDAELIQQVQREYEAAAQHGGQEAVDACFRCVAPLCCFGSLPDCLSVLFDLQWIARLLDQPRHSCTVTPTPTQAHHPQHPHLRTLSAPARADPSCFTHVIGWRGRWCTRGRAAPTCSAASSWRRR